MIGNPDKKIPTPKDVFFDPETFASTFLKILDKNKKLIPLRCNAVQKDFLRNRTQKTIVLKSRQHGLTTLIQAEMFRYVTTGTATTFTLTHLDSTTAAIRRMADRYYNSLPEGFRPARKYANAIVTTYSDFGSEAIIATAGSVNSARGLTISHAHLSEVGFWPHADEVMISVLQAVSPDGTVTVESTANGASGWLYTECMKALNGESAWTLLFYPWFLEPSYSLLLKSGQVLTLDDAEQKLVAEFNLSLGQLNWRREKIKELGFIENFNQEYPSDVITAFKTSGNSVFGDFAAALYKLPEGCDPIREAQPIEGHNYVGAIDWGQSSNFSAMSIIDATDNVEVCLWRRNHARWDEMRGDMARMAQAWQVGHLYVEKNSASSNLEALQAEMEILQRDQSWQTSVIGFTTTNKRKADMVTNFYAGIHEDHLKLIDYPFATAELRSFQSVQAPSGVWTYDCPVTADGSHGDTVIARIGAYWGSLRLIPDGEW